VIGHDAWEKLSAEQRIIVLDHELCHAAGQDLLGRWTLTGHDVEEFSAIIRRYGTWTADLQLFAKEVAQLSLPIAGSSTPAGLATATNAAAATSKASSAPPPRSHARRVAPKARSHKKKK
jgi:hypothetical protein